MQTLTVTASLRITNAIRQNSYRYRGGIKIPTNKSLAATAAAAYRANKENKERKRNHAHWLEAALSLIALMALPGVIVGGAVAFFTRKVQRAARAFLLAELVWLLALALVAVLPAHGTQTAIWLHPTINTRLIYEKVRAGASYEQALRDTQPAMRRKLEADTFGCAKTMPRTTSIVMCLEQCGRLRVGSAQAEVDRHDGIVRGFLLTAERARPGAWCA